MIRKVRLRLWAAIFFLFNRNTLNNRSKKFFKCLKNGSDRLLFASVLLSIYLLLCYPCL